MSRKKQYVVLGLGNFGTSVALSLQRLGCEVIAVDEDMEKVEQIAESVSYAMKANINDPDLLKSLEVENLDGIIIAISENMETNIMAALLAKEAGASYVLAKARDEMHGTILKKLGVDAIVYPEWEMGARVAKNLVSTNFADWITLSPEYSMIEMSIPKKWAGQTLTELDVRKEYGVSVVGYMDGDEVEINPNPNVPLKENIILILVGKNKDLQLLRSI